LEGIRTREVKEINLFSIFVYRVSKGNEGEKECEEKFFFFRLVFDSTDEILFRFAMRKLDKQRSKKMIGEENFVLLHPALRSGNQRTLFFSALRYRSGN
jgi:hypothetical protein